MDQIKTNTAGTLDPSFGRDGVVKLPFPDIVGGIPTAVLALPNNKLLIAVSLTEAQNSPAKVIRLNKAGEIDYLFGAGGFVDIPFGGEGRFVPLRLRPLQKRGWVIVGMVEENPGDIFVNLAIVRQFEDGQLDASFGNDGKVILKIYELLDSCVGADARFFTRRHNEKSAETHGEIPEFVAVSAVEQQDGKLVLVSTVFFEFDNSLGIVLRLDVDGSLDKTFNQTGFVFVNLPGVTHSWTYAQGVAIQEDGKVLVCGDFIRNETGAFVEAYVLRYLQDGTVDSEYGASGLVAIKGNGTKFSLEAMALKPDGGIVAAGTSGTHDKETGLLVVLNPGGDFHHGFNNGKPVISDFLPNGLSWRRCALQTDGKIIVTGQGGGQSLDENSTMVTARYLADGSLDQLFGDDGWADFNDGAGLVLHKDSVVTVGNQVVVCGRIINPVQGNVVRYLG
ncbi:NHL repeat-containing protein [Pseudomonas sp. LB3P58]